MMVRRLGIEEGRPALRALRQQPLMVDVRAAGARLRTEGAPNPDMRDGAAWIPHVDRWSRAWLVCAQATLATDPRYMREEPWTIPLVTSSMYMPRGGDDSDRVSQAVARLEASGIISVSRSDSPDRIALIDRQFFMPHPAGIALDWKECLAACGNEPATLLVLHALAEVIVPLDAWTAVPRRDLMEATGYQQKQVRVALRRLEAAGVLEAEGDAGVTARYRFSGRALGRTWETSAPGPVSSAPGLVPSAMVDDVRVPAPMPRGIPELSPDTDTSTLAANLGANSGLRVTVGGVTITLAPGAEFAIGAGVQARLEMGADGNPVLSVGGKGAQ